MTIFVHRTAGAEHTDENKYYNDKEGSDGSACDCGIPASQTQRIRMTVTRNAPVTIFNNLAQSELNTKYI